MCLFLFADVQPTFLEGTGKPTEYFTYWQIKSICFIWEGKILGDEARGSVTPLQDFLSEVQDSSTNVPTSILVQVYW